MPRLARSRNRHAQRYSLRNRSDVYQSTVVTCYNLFTGCEILSELKSLVLTIYSTGISTLLVNSFRIFITNEKVKF